MVNSRELYDRYRMIRDCVNYAKCKRLPLHQVRERVDEQLEFVCKLCHLSAEEVYFALDYCEINFPAVK